MSDYTCLLPSSLPASNMIKAVKIRDRISQDIVKPSNRLIHYLRGMHKCTLEMFQTSQFSSPFRDLIQKAMFDRGMQVALENQKELNWCREVKKLVPLKTDGDGNCLLHAVSQYMWGVQDTDLVLRKLLHNVMKDTEMCNFKLRWQHSCLRSKEFVETELHYDTRNWDEEWEKLVEMASASKPPSHTGLRYDSLEEVHVFVLSNILRRPIIVLADKILRSLESGSSFAPLNVGGIYLPLHWPKEECYSFPIVLCYESNHFAPLVILKDSSPEIRAVPLEFRASGKYETMKVHFLLPSGEPPVEKLLRQYLCLIDIPVHNFENGTTDIIKAAKLDEGNVSEDLNLAQDYAQLAAHEYRRWQEHAQFRVRKSERFSISQLSLLDIKCATSNCTYYASSATRPYCHECYKEKRNEKCDNKKQSSRTWTSDVRTSGSVNGRTQFCLPSYQSSEITSGPHSAPPTAPSLSFFSETNAMKCRNLTCPFTLNVEYSGLCEHCFQAMQTEHRTTVQEPHGANNFLQPGLGNHLLQDLTRCKLCHCMAAKICNGICGPCLEKSSNQNVFPHIMHQRSSSDPAQWTGVHASPAFPLLPSGQQGDLQVQINHTPEENSGAKKCKKSGCSFFGTKDKHGFCTLCFFEFCENNGEKTAQNARRTQKSPHNIGCPATTAPAFKNSVCLSQECNVGDTLLEGYCQRCFLDAQDRRYWEAKRAGDQVVQQQNIAVQNRDLQRNSSNKTKKCSKSHCTNLIKPRDELCSECRHRSSHRGSREQAIDDTQKKCCWAPGCDHYGNVKCHGYCNECYLFKQIYENHPRT
ncbi:tumor necrosis factor alpha-induced protein 3 [Protopterus annectens]|uniref:tumor necrosis factor alpha-induced protein 3 n=1 Tax=Protopterus annectens TaxID=7888 RepID=UPI001CFA1B23|nr:tumor necrosis factor alpha-induced protein 3 [Protopterus annectens]